MALKWLLANAIGDCLAFAAYYLGRGIVSHVRRERRKHQELEHLIREMTNEKDNKGDVRLARRILRSLVSGIINGALYKRSQASRRKE